MAAKNQYTKRVSAQLPSSRTAPQPTGVYMYAAGLPSLPAPSKDSPSNLDDEDYDDGGAVTISLPVKGKENKEAPFNSKPAQENNCRKLHVHIPYVLVVIGVAMWMTLFFLVLEKYSAISEKLQNLNLNNSEKFMKTLAILEELQHQSLNCSEKFMKESFCTKGNFSVIHSCPQSWKSERKYCYYFSTQKKNWTNALWNCINHKAYLVSIWSDEEQDFLRNNVNKINNYWLGMNDFEGQWKWKDGDMLIPIAFWDQGEPSKEVNKHCGIMQPNGTWASAVCSLHNQWICKKRSIC